MALEYWILSAILVTVSVFDLEWRLIPDMITIPGIAVGLLFSVIANQPSILSSFAGIMAGGGILFLMALIGDKLFKKESMGGGDIKLAAMLGAFFGAFPTLVVVLIAALMGSLVSVPILLISKYFRQKRLIPFGPCLGSATLLFVFLGNDFWELYLTICKYFG